MGVFITRGGCRGDGGYERFYGFFVHVEREGV